MGRHEEKREIEVPRLDEDSFWNNIESVHFFKRFVLSLVLSSNEISIRIQLFQKEERKRNNNPFYENSELKIYIAFNNNLCIASEKIRFDRSTKAK